MFEIITEKSYKHLQADIDMLKEYCEKDESVKEMVSYILKYNDESSIRTHASVDALIGHELTIFIWQITRFDLSALTNQYHFPVNWAGNLNSFIGNFVYDDSAFTFTRSYNGTFVFDATTDDAELWLQNPKILVEAAKVNVAYHLERDKVGIFGMGNYVVDDSKIKELLK